MRQGMFDGHPLPQVGATFGSLLLLAQYLQQAFIRGNGPMPSMGTDGTAVMQRARGTAVLGNVQHA